ncbi:response regulator [Geothrix sp.]|jgi:CheY-like chemotaxis protein|uniref:response regulator n=1 Tax=Geothrix sp. TaxID=1962974 RepID=UPI0025BED671|nr:response regulator [Geothrix sp.]
MIQEPILIVDDEPEVRTALLEALQSRGYSAEAAADGEAALARMAETPFPLVLTDLHMPGGLSGLELIAALKQRHPDAICILITAFATLDTTIGALKQGAYDLIQKPFRLAEIEVVLDRALDHARLLKTVRAYQAELEARILSRSQDLRAAHEEALDLCDLSLQGLEAPSLEVALGPLLDRLVARCAPDGLACYRHDADGQLRAVARRGTRPLPVALERPLPGPLPAPALGYPEEHLVPLGSTGWLYLGFEDRSSFQEASPGFLLLARHLELALRVR